MKDFNKMSVDELCHTIAETIRGWYFQSGNGRRCEAASVEALEGMLKALVKGKR